MRRVGRVGAGELADTFQTVGQGAHAEGEAAGGLGGDTAGVEVRGERVEEGLGAAASRGERSQRDDDEVRHGLPVAREDRIDEEVGGVQHGLVQAEPLGQFEGVQCLLVGLDDTAGTGLGAADGDPAAVGGGVRLLGEVGENLVLVARRDAQQPAVLGGEQDAAVAEPGDERALHLPGHRGALVVGVGPLRDGDGVRVGEAQPEAFRAFGEAAEVAAAVEKVVDELPAGGLLLAYGEELGAFVAFGEGVDGLVHGGERVVGGAGRPRPRRAGGGQMRADEGAQPVARLGGKLAQGAAGGQFVAGEATPGGRHLGQDLGVTAQILLRNLPLRHAVPRSLGLPLTPS